MYVMCVTGTTAMRKSRPWPHRALTYAACCKRMIIISLFLIYPIFSACVLLSFRRWRHRLNPRGPPSPAPSGKPTEQRPPLVLLPPRPRPRLQPPVQAAAGLATGPLQQQQLPPLRRGTSSSTLRQMGQQRHSTTTSSSARVLPLPLLLEEA